MKKLLLVFGLACSVNMYAQNSSPGSYPNYKAEQLELIKKSIEEKGGVQEIPAPEPKPSSGLRTSAVPQTVDNRISIGCQDLFLNGTNIAWVNFAMDVGEDPDNGNQQRPNMTKFESVFDQAQASGMNTIRWWLHTNGSHSPSFDGNNMTSGLSTYMVEDMKAVLDAAWERNLRVQICLWSFDMMKSDQYKVNINNTEKLLTEDAALTAYIDNALIPMVNGLEGHPGLMAWEVFNEPEGMTNEFGWSGVGHVPMADIQKVVNRCAGAIHREDPEVLVTSGSWAFDAHTDLGSYTNYYTDARLIAAGGDNDGTLDFYNVHYYSWAGQSRSPFHNAYSHWGLDKPLVVAEYYPNDQEDDPNVTELFGVPFEDLPQKLYETGYAGQLNWSETDRTWAQISGPIDAFYAYLENNNELDEITINKTACGEAYFVVSDLEICQGETVSFSEMTDNAVSYTWSFDEGASQPSYNAMTPPDITYSTSGEKTISLTVENTGGNITTYQKKVNVISSESSYDVSIITSASMDCQLTINAGFEVAITPEISGSAEDVTVSPAKTEWEDASTQNEFIIESDGTIDGMENASLFIGGVWSTWTSNYYDFTGTFGSGATASITISVDVENSNPRELTVLIDGTIEEVFDATNGGGVVTVDVPVGTHTITFKNTGNDWVQAQSFTFTGLGLDLSYEWFYNGIQLNTDASLTSVEVPSWDVNDEIYVGVVTGELEKCVASTIYSDTLVNDGCITSVDYVAKQNEVEVFPNPFTSELTVDFEGEISVMNINGALLSTTAANGLTKLGQNLEPGIYILSLKNNEVQKTLKIIKQ